MNLRTWLERAGLTKLKLNVKVLEAEWEPAQGDRDAAWELYVEMLTRIVTQPLPRNHGDEKTALDSVYSLFAVTREILRRRGRRCVGFTRIAVVVLNQVVRPFTAKWHPLSLAGTFEKASGRREFRKELEKLQADLRRYAGLLAAIAEVEDLTDLSDS